MKPFHFQARAALKFVFNAGLFLLLASCAHRFILSSPGQLSQLPVSRGLNGGSYVAETEWKYLGSNEQAHEFLYYYNEDNLLLHQPVSIPRSSPVLHFREMKLDAKPQWVTLQTNSGTFQFYSHQPFRR